MVLQIVLYWWEEQYDGLAANSSSVMAGIKWWHQRRTALRQWIDGKNNVMSSLQIYWLESQKYQAELIGIAEHWSRTGWRQDFTGSILSQRGPNRLHGSSGVVPDGNNTLRNWRKILEPNTTATRTCSFTQSNLVVKLTETVLFTSSSDMCFCYYVLELNLCIHKSFRQFETPKVGSQWF